MKRFSMLLLVFVLAACGGGNGGPGTPLITLPPLPSDFSTIGHTQIDSPTDLWLHGDVAYIGSNTGDSPSPVRVVDISDPSDPRLISSIEVDSAKTNDVIISEDGSFAVIPHEQSNDGLNGITLLDLADPTQPTVITRFTEELGHGFGVQNLWIDGSVLYVVLNVGGRFEDLVDPMAGMRIIDVSDPAAPQLITTYYGGSSIIFDIHVVDGLAFVPHWDLGLIILDVGNGMAGGSPANPVEIGRENSFGRIGSVLYWPETGYVFLTGGTRDAEQVIVVDARDLQNPIQVATAELPDFYPGKFALDKDRQILYVAWTDRGLVAIDVGGTLSGDLIAQGRLLGEVETLIFSIGVQLHKGLVWVTAGGFSGTGQLQVWEPTF